MKVVAKTHCGKVRPINEDHAQLLGHFLHAHKVLCLH